MFDGAWYLDCYPDVAAAGVNPFVHYLTVGALEGRDPHPLFDTAWYLSRNPSVAAAGTNPLVDYVTRGAREGRDPHPLFDTAYYLTRCPAAGGSNPLVHYLTTGAEQGFDPHPLFDGEWYRHTYQAAAGEVANPLVDYLTRGLRDQRNPHPLFDSAWYAEVNPAVAALQVNPLVHYLATGAAEGLDPHPLFDTAWLLRTEPALAQGGRNPLVQFLTQPMVPELSPHPLFDSAHYLRRNLDVAIAKINPLLHYVRTGAAESRSPHVLFDPAWYLAHNPDVAAEGANPLVHYVKNGGTERRDPHPLFNAAFYASTAKLDRDVNPLAHYIVYGAAMGLPPNELFDGPWYLEYNADVRATGTDPLTHYVEHGAADNRDPCDLFATGWYLAQNPDVAATGWNPLAHFIHHGAAQGRDPSPLFHSQWYLNRYPHIADAGLNPLAHYLRVGAVEGYFPNALFDSAWYLQRNIDVAVSLNNPLGHYGRSGAREGREPHPLFDTAWYLEQNTDVSTATMTPLEHWFRIGRPEGRPSPIRRYDAKMAGSLALATLCDPHRDEHPAPMTADLLFSVLTPAYNTEPSLLRELYQTLRNQTYTLWEWVVWDDGSTRSQTIAALREIAATDKRVKLHLAGKGGGISKASNGALALATGSYVALVDHDDLLARDVLAKIHEAIQQNGGDADMIYTDECKLSESGEIYDIFLKPDWSPTLLENTMYIGHLTVYATEMVRRLGGFRSEFDGTQDYDLALRAALQATRVLHVCSIGYLWRAVEGSTAQTLDAKDYAVARQQTTVQSHAARRSPTATVQPGHSPGYWRTDYPLPDRPPLVSFVVPTAAGSRLVRGQRIDLIVHSLESLASKRFYPRYEVIVIHNGNLSREQTERLLAMPEVRLVEYRSEVFNLAEKINLGAREANGDYVCLMNDDIEAITPEGGAFLVGFMEAHPQVGAMAPHCLFEDGRSQHNGVMLLEQGPSHAGIFQRPDYGGHAGFLRCRREMFAVTGALLFVRRQLYLDLGGFDEGLPLNYNDVDFCLRVRKAGYSAVVDPAIEVYHFESASKVGTFRCEKESLYRRWPGLRDPYFNPGFDQRNPAFIVDEHPRAVPFSDPVRFENWLDHQIGNGRGRTDGPIRFSLCISIYNQPASMLREMFASIAMQTWPDWEMVIVDDASTLQETRDWVDQLKPGPNLKVFRFAKNQGIAGAQHRMLELAEGDFLIPIDADDYITVDALAVMADAIQRRPEADVFYSDEFKSNPQSEKFAPFFKPDFDPVAIANCCYTCHIMAMRTSFLRAIDAHSDGRATWCHDWDTTLRSLDAGREPVHVPALLYAWRINPGSTASMESGGKPEAVASQRFVLERTLSNRGLTDLLRVEPNTVGPQTGMWMLHAERPVDKVTILDARALWSSDRARSLLEQIDPNAAWIALLSAADAQEREAAVLALSAPAHWDKRVGVVSALLAQPGTGKVLWSGGMLTPSGPFDPSYGDIIVEGGYHGRLFCQRCVDIAAPIDVLIRRDRLVAALAHLDTIRAPVTPSTLMVALGQLAAAEGWLVSVTPALIVELPSDLRFLVPLDREGLVDQESASMRPSRWYGGHLDTGIAYTPRMDEGMSRSVQA